MLAGRALCICRYLCPHILPPDANCKGIWPPFGTGCGCGCSCCCRAAAPQRFCIGRIRQLVAGGLIEHGGCTRVGPLCVHAGVEMSHRAAGHEQGASLSCQKSLPANDLGPVAAPNRGRQVVSLGPADKGQAGHIAACVASAVILPVAPGDALLLAPGQLRTADAWHAGAGG